MRILRHKLFLKSFDKVPKKIQYQAIERLEIFLDHPFDPILRNHALKGKWIGFRSIDISGDYRIIFRELSDGKYELVELVKIGTHSQLYG
ncbi:MAG: type II toxin-antitoxin system mRNA interferase toxin, RelE/StbE family [candidate division SR1 bacterium]|nr:MAG: type II toxin-antitoxin system mRNA interferase toxin, RelE/StbE family [candidate division SR1 bacterium]